MRFGFGVRYTPVPHGHIVSIGLKEISHEIGLDGIRDLPDHAPAMLSELDLILARQAAQTQAAVRALHRSERVFKAATRTPWHNGQPLSRLISKIANPSSFV
jgi:hypothetical protein